MFHCALLVFLVTLFISTHGATFNRATFIKTEIQSGRAYLVHHAEQVTREDTPASSPTLVPPGAPLHWKSRSTFGTFHSTAFSHVNSTLFVSTSDVYSEQYPDFAQLFSFKGEKLFEQDSSHGGLTSVIARHGDIAASVLYDEVQTKVTLTVWKGTRQLYTKDFEVHIPTESPIAISDDGKRIVLLMTKFDFSPDNTRLHSFDALSGKSLGEWTFEEGCRHLTLSNSGERAAFHIGTQIIVFDLVKGATEWKYDLEASDYALGFSPGGDYIAFGWFTLFVFARNAQGQWSQITSMPRPGDFFVGDVSVDAEGNSLVSWQSFAATSFRIDYVQKGKSTPESSFSSGVSTGLQNPAWAVKLTEDGKFGVVASWGEGPDSQTPELYVFGTKNLKMPLFTYKAAGSLFDADIIRTPDGKALHIVCGSKIGHANSMGRGGELAVFELPLQ